MSEKYKARNPDGLYFATLTVIDWVDLFIRPAYKHILIEPLQYCQKNKGLRIFAYVIMSSHLHLIVKSGEEASLSEIIRDFKRYTNGKLIEAINNSTESRKIWLLNKFEFAAKRIKRNNHYKIWKDGYHPIELDNNNIIVQKLEYIHNNPVEQEIVIDAVDYKYSSAKNYSGEKGELEIEFL